MQSKNVTLENPFIGQVPEKTVNDILKAISALGFTISYYPYDVNTEVYDDPISIPVYIEELPLPQEGLISPDRELYFIFSTESFNDNSVVPNKDKDKVEFNGDTYDLVNRFYVNPFSHTDLFEKSILVRFKAIKRAKLTRSDVL